VAAPADDKGEEVRALIQSVNPMDAKAGDEIVASGTNLGKKFILELYLTNGKDDVKVDMLKQVDNEITFKVPKGINGRYRLMIMTNAIEPKFVEQPVRVNVEE
jgi:hypothetical protein